MTPELLALAFIGGLLGYIAAMLTMWRIRWSEKH